VFRLIGTWWPVALDSDENARASATDIARGTLGTADQNATPRRRMRDDLVEAARAARDAQGRLLLLQTELAPNEPMSAMLTLFDDDRFRMSPSIGTNPERVLSVLEEALPTIAPEMAGTAVRRPFTDGEVVRAHRVDESVEVEDGATFTSGDSSPTTGTPCRIRRSSPCRALEPARRHPERPPAYFDASSRCRGSARRPRPPSTPRAPPRERNTMEGYASRRP
jgi:hypothetical protein